MGVGPTKKVGYYIYWLVVSNICFIFHNIWGNPSHWLISFKMVKTTNQIYSTLQLWMFHPKSWVFFSRKWLNKCWWCYRMLSASARLNQQTWWVEATRWRCPWDFGGQKMGARLMIWWWLPLGNCWFIDGFVNIPSGKLTVCYWKCPWK